MKRYIFLLLAVVSITASYSLLRDGKVSAGNHSVDWSLATVQQPAEVILPDHYSVLDSLYRQSADRHSTYKIARGDTFAGILKRQGIKSATVAALTRQVSKKLDMSAFQVGRELEIYRDGVKEAPSRLEYALSPTTSLVINVEQLAVEIEEKEVQTKVVSFQSRVLTSVANTMQVKGMPTDLADKLLSIFAWDIDFSRLLKSDEIQMVCELELVEGEVIGSGRILAAVFMHKDRKYQAYYFENDTLQGYFDERGRNLSRAPLQYEMITSLYQRRRFHPVKRRYRAHLGMDFMAPEGTAVRALKDGVVIAAGFRRANGNYVKIQHEKIITQYLHLSQVDARAKVGEKISRGEEIGKVGSTGLSSGPHLCLRVWENGTQKDPLDYQFERNTAIGDENRKDFEAVMSAYQEQLVIPITTAD